MSEHRVGHVTHWYGKIRVAVVKLEQGLRLGDTVRIRGAHDDLRVRITSMEMDHRPVAAAAAGQEVGIKVPRRAHAGSDVLWAEAAPWWKRLLGWA